MESTRLLSFSGPDFPIYNFWTEIQNWFLGGRENVLNRWIKCEGPLKHQLNKFTWKCAYRYYSDETSPTENFKRVRVSIKPPVWPLAFSPNLSESSLARWLQSPASLALSRRPFGLATLAVTTHPPNWVQTNLATQRRTKQPNGLIESWSAMGIIIIMILLYGLLDDYRALTTHPPNWVQTNLATPQQRRQRKELRSRWRAKG